MRKKYFYIVDRLECDEPWTPAQCNDEEIEFVMKVKPVKKIKNKFYLKFLLILLFIVYLSSISYFYFITILKNFINVLQ